ncbi:MAG: FixH family protein [Bacteriovoracales bacterium]
MTIQDMGVSYKEIKLITKGIIMQNVIKILSTIIFLISTFSAFGSDPQQHLSFSNDTIHADVTWATGPQNEKESVMLVKFRAAEKIDNLDLKVSLFMPEMGHGSSPTKVEKIPGGNIYKISKVFFTMPGIWEVRVTLRIEDGPKETQAFSLNI